MLKNVHKSLSLIRCYSSMKHPFDLSSSASSSVSSATGQTASENEKPDLIAGENQHYRQPLNVPLSEIQFYGELPKDRIKSSFTLGSGPGGQNVNKNPTKAEIRFRIDHANWLPKKLREKFVEKFPNHFNQSKEFIMTSMRTRNGLENLEDCYSKLRLMIDVCSMELIKENQLPSDKDKEIIAEKAEIANNKRMVAKAKRSFKKQMRKSYDL